MARRRELQTARSRRALDPIIWTIDGTDIHLRDDLVVTDLAELSDVLVSAGTTIPEGEQATPVEMLRATNTLVRGIVNTMVELIVADDQEAWHRLAPALDPMDLVSLVYDLVEEVSGKNPTSPSASSAGSPPTGVPSTAGAQPTGSTPLPSPSIEP